MPAEPFSAEEKNRASAAGAQLQAVFEKIYRQRMSDMPVINPKLEVAAIGFSPWRDAYLGILVTPWFMNLMLLPQQVGQWDDLPELSEQSQAFPSGQYRFITGYEPAIGKYQMCSLFSPMFEFADQAAAVETAEVALCELLNEAHAETADIDSVQIAKIWNGSEAKPQADAEEQAERLSEAEKQAVLQQPTLGQKISQPLSRRDLLRGALFKSGEQS